MALYRIVLNKTDKTGSWLLFLQTVPESKEIGVKPLPPHRQKGVQKS
jgi:hypothetical protein